MSRHIRLDIAPATATHCGVGGVAPENRCSNVGGWGECDAFGRETLGIDEDADEYLRLPECLAAEKGASECVR